MTLSVQNLHVFKGGTQILGPVDCMFEPGIITAICGPNGAGKSTLLSALAGLERPTRGVVFYGDRALLALHPRKRAQAIGYLPQDGDVAWDVSVRNLVALGRMPHRDMAEEPVDRSLDLLDLQNLAARPVSTLSGGEKARALLARVLATEPDWILADEPLAALDLAHQLTLLEVLRRQAREGMGVVLVVHDLAIAMNHADRVIVLDGGSVAEEGRPAQALSEEAIERIWKVKISWQGKEGAMALSL